jgi:hypothetical protein
MVSSDFGGVPRPRKQTPGTQLQALTLGPDLRVWQQPRKWTLCCVLGQQLQLRALPPLPKVIGSRCQVKPKTLPKEANIVRSCWARPKTLQKGAGSGYATPKDIIIYIINILNFIIINSKKIICIINIIFCVIIKIINIKNSIISIINIFYYN